MSPAQDGINTECDLKNQNSVPPDSSCVSIKHLEDYRIPNFMRKDKSEKKNVLRFVKKKVCLLAWGGFCLLGINVSQDVWWTLTQRTFNSSDRSAVSAVFITIAAFLRCLWTLANISLPLASVYFHIEAWRCHVTYNNSSSYESTIYLAQVFRTKLLMGTHQIHNFRLRFGELSKVDPQQTCHFIFITQNKHAAFFFNSPELKITHVWLLVSLWTGTVVVLLFWSSYVCFVCFLGLCLFCFSFLFFIFSLHTCLVCLISPALLPELFPRPLSLHTCAASPSLAPPSSQCSSMCYPHLCYLRLFVFKSSLFLSSHAEEISSSKPHEDTNLENDDVKMIYESMRLSWMFSQTCLIFISELLCPPVRISCQK